MRVVGAIAAIGVVVAGCGGADFLPSDFGNEDVATWDAAGNPDEATDDTGDPLDVGANDVQQPNDSATAGPCTGMKVECWNECSHATPDCVDGKWTCLPPKSKAKALDCGFWDEPKDPGPEADVATDACAPDCEGKGCGPDGCGGVCGTCTNTDKPVCNPATGACGPQVCTFPTTWGPVGVVATLQIPGDAPGSAACPDLSGDGVGDNGLMELAPTWNPQLATAIPSIVAILFEFVGVDDPTTDNPAFKLVVLMGKPTAPGATTYQVDPASYDLATPSGECRPLIFFDGAKIAKKSLTAGPSLLSLTIPVQELGGNVSATIQHTRLSATLVDGSLTASDGLLSGILTKDQVDAFLLKLEVVCQAPDPPDLCKQLESPKPFPMITFDPDLDKDGKKDAASLCFRFTLAGGTIVGMKP